MEDVIQVATEIQKCISQLTKAIKDVKTRSERLAQAIANYDKRLAIVMIQLKNGYEFEVDGQKIKEVSATNLEKVAKGICWKEKLELETAEAEYKSVITFIETVKAQLNGWQSINRYLESR